MKGSNRTFHVAHTSNRAILLEKFTLEQLLQEDCNCELRYSIQDYGVDNLLDLHLNESFVTKFRDEDSTILVLRIR